MRAVVICVVCLLASAAAVLAQNKSAAFASAPDNPLSSYNKHIYEGMKAIVLRAADKMPQENYTFKPTDAVRSFGQILEHIARAQYMFCSTALGEKNPDPMIEQSKASKTELIATVKSAFAYCDKAYVELMGSGAPKLGF